MGNFRQTSFDRRERHVEHARDFGELETFDMAKDECCSVRRVETVEHGADPRYRFSRLEIGGRDDARTGRVPVVTCQPLPLAGAAKAYLADGDAK